MSQLQINTEFLSSQLLKLLSIPSPVGFTDKISEYLEGELDALGYNVSKTNRGALYLTLGGSGKAQRAVIAHLDTIGCMVSSLKDNGRLGITSVGTWSSRFAEGARVSIFAKDKEFRGSILPLKASGHAYGKMIDYQKSSWDDVELRVDERCDNQQDIRSLGINIGDFIAVDPNPEELDSGFVVSRHIDGKGGVAILLSLLHAFYNQKLTPATDTVFIFSVSEEVGTGATSVLSESVKELVVLDMAALAPIQNSSEFGATIILKDKSGPFDYRLSRQLIDLAETGGINYSRDLMRSYFCDANGAIRSGADVRAALIGYGVDSSHGYERAHIDSLSNVGSLLSLYLQSDFR